MKMLILNRVRSFLNEGHKVVDFEDFNNRLLDLTTTNLDDDQVKYPKIDKSKTYYLIGGNNYDLSIINRETLPDKGPFELLIENNDGDTIGFIRGNKSGGIISFNLIHILETHRGFGIGTEIYKKFLDNGFTIKSDSEITDSTYSLYYKLVKQYNYKPLIFNDGRVGIQK